MNALKTAWDNYLIRLFTGGLAIFKFILQMQLVFFRAKNAIVGFILDMSVKVVEFLQDMVNGAIGVINKFIELLNKIPGVAISAIEEVTFAATFAAKVETTKANMEEGYALQEAAHNESIANMTQLLDNFKTDAADREQDRLNEIAEAQEDAQGDGEDGLDTDPSELPEGGGSGDDGGGGGGAVAANTGATAGNTAAMLDSIDLANEELKYLRELAEQEAINRFTTAEIKVEMQNDNYISSDTDIDGIVNLLSESLEEAMAAAAEGA
jgi:hypothetical protein